MQRYMVIAPSHLPRMISQSRTGEVISSSMVPVRFSSANRRMEISGIRNSPTTLALPSSGAMTYSLMLMGCCLAAHLRAQAGDHEVGGGAVEEEAEDEAEQRHQQIGDRRGEIRSHFLAANGEDVSHWVSCSFLPWLPASSPRTRFASDFVSSRKISSSDSPTVAQFGEIPSGLHDGARQIRPHRVVFQTFDFKRRPRRRGCRATPRCATPATCSRRCLHVPARRARRLRCATIRWRGAGCADWRPNRTATISPLLMMMTLLQDCSTSDRMCVLRMMVWSPERLAISWRASRCCSRVEAGGGLVENQHRRVVDDRLGEADALPVAFGELADDGVFDVGDGGALAHFVDALRDVAGRDALQFRDEGEVVGDLHLRDRAAGFRAGSRCVS